MLQSHTLHTRDKIIKAVTVAPIDMPDVNEGRSDLRHLTLLATIVQSSRIDVLSPRPVGVSFEILWGLTFSSPPVRSDQFSEVFYTPFVSTYSKRSNLLFETIRRANQVTSYDDWWGCAAKRDHDARKSSDASQFLENHQLIQCPSISEVVSGQ